MVVSPLSPSVLIVDDSPGTLLSMHRLLSPHLSVTMVSSARAALEALTPETVMVLTDMQMPEVNGLELARTLRQGRPELAVVLMSAVVEDGLRQQAREVGVLDVLSKPLRSEVVLAALRGWLDGEGPAAQGPDPHPDPQPAAPALPAPELTFEAARDCLDGTTLLPGVLTAYVFGAQGELIAGSSTLPAQLGAYLGFLSSTSGALGQQLGSAAPMQAAQLEFADRVLVVCPLGAGLLAAVVQDAPAASGVKAWMRRCAGKLLDPPLH